MIAIKVLSDLHISDEFFENNFHLNEKKFISYLKRSLNECDYVILNGDVFELWETKIPFIKKYKLKKIQKTYQLLFNFIESQLNDKQSNLFYNIGNHDRYLLKKKIFLRLQEKLEINYANKKVYIEHGYMPDLLNSYLRYIGEFLTWLGAWTERLFYYNIDSRIFSKVFRKKLLMKLYSKLNLEYYDIVVLGHLHEKLLDISKDNKRIYVNSGKCCGSKMFDETIIKIWSTGKIKVDQKSIKLV